MAVLVDSNILLRSMQPGHPHSALAERAISALRARNETLCLAPQNLIEFWAVATRQLTDNGLGMPHSAAAAELSNLLQLFHFLPAIPDVFEEWRRLVDHYRVTGKVSHDAHLVAVMRVYGITDILTFNAADFRRFSGVAVLDPAGF